MKAIEASVTIHAANLRENNKRKRKELRLKGWGGGL